MGRKPLDLSKHPPFDRLTVLGLSEERCPASGRLARERGWTLKLWRCQCVCGNIVLVTTDNLRSRKTRSCGCLQKDEARAGGERAARRDHRKTCKVCETPFLGTARQMYCDDCRRRPEDS